MLRGIHAGESFEIALMITKLFRDDHAMLDQCVARAESASPSTGSHLVHETEQADLLRRAVG